MNEIDAGDCSGLTMEEIKAEYDKLICKNLASHRIITGFLRSFKIGTGTNFSTGWTKHLFTYLVIFCPLRYPNGESYEVRKTARNIDPVFARTWWQGWSL